MPRATLPATTGGDIRGEGFVYDPERPTRSEPRGEMPRFPGDDPDLPDWMRRLYLVEAKIGRKLSQQRWKDAWFKDQLKGMNDFDGFWFMLQHKMDQIGSWQARFFLKYIFRHPVGKKGEMGFIPGRDIKMGQPYKGIITTLASKAATGGGIPAGWRGLESLMYKTPTSFWNPYGSKKGLATAVISGNIYSPSIDRFGRVSRTDRYHPVRQFMDKWELENPAALDTFAPVYMTMWQREHRANVMKVEAERKKGPPGMLESYLMGMAPKLTAMALGGTGFALGGALAGTGAAVGGGAFGDAVSQAGAVAGGPMAGAGVGAGWGAGAGKGFIPGIGKAVQDLGALMWRGATGSYPQRSGMGLRGGEGPINIWEGPSSIFKDIMPRPREGELPLAGFPSDEEDLGNLMWPDRMRFPWESDFDPYGFGQSPYGYGYNRRGW